MITRSAPAKLILCGEHAVVYRRPAIALPLSDVRASATVSPGPAGVGLCFDAPDLGGGWAAADEPDNPLSELAALALERFGAPPGDLLITLQSAIPIASGMGSGAAIGTALVRALAAFHGHEPPPDAVAALVYASERRYHGTPSGIDNTVVAHERPILFQRGEPGTSPTIRPVQLGAPLQLIIGDTGVRSATRLPVGAVRERWTAEPAVYEALFDQVGALVAAAEVCLASGDHVELGRLLDQNQILLARMGVSSPELEQLIGAARAAGALGAKLSGAGWGGVMLALVTDKTRPAVVEALRNAGAARVLNTTVAIQSG